MAIAVDIGLVKVCCYDEGKQTRDRVGSAEHLHPMYLWVVNGNGQVMVLQ